MHILPWKTALLFSLTVAPATAVGAYLFHHDVGWSFSILVFLWAWYLGAALFYRFRSHDVAQVSNAVLTICTFFDKTPGMLHGHGKQTALYITSEKENRDELCRLADRHKNKDTDSPPVVSAPKGWVSGEDL